MITVLTSRTQEREKTKRKRKRRRERSRREKDRGKPAEAGDEGPQDSTYICARIERTRRFSLRFFKVLFFFSLMEVYTRGRHACKFLELDTFPWRVRKAEIIRIDLQMNLCSAMLG